MGLRHELPMQTKRTRIIRSAHQWSPLVSSNCIHFALKQTLLHHKFTATGAAVMVWRQPLARMIHLAIAGVLACFVLALVASEPADPWRCAKCLENQSHRDIRLPSPQRGRGVGGEGNRQAVIRW